MKKPIFIDNRTKKPNNKGYYIGGATLLSIVCLLFVYKLFSGPGGPICRRGEKVKTVDTQETFISNSCAALEGTLRSRFGAIYRSQQAHSLDNPSLVTGKTESEVLERLGVSMEPIGEDLPDLFGAEGKTSDYFEMSMPISTETEFSLRADPVSARVHGIVLKVVRTEETVTGAVCESTKVGQPAKDPKVVNGKMECAG